MRPRPRVLLAALAIDVVCGEPPACLHPVVGMGQLLAWLERRAPAGERARLAYGALIAVGLPLAWAGVVERVLGGAAWPIQALALKPTLAGRSLLDAGRRVERALVDGDADAARHALRALVSRSTDGLDTGHLASAAVESLAENLVDSWLAPMLAYAAAGVSGAYAYRAANTADAMWGYHTPTFEQLGKGSARLDDALNWLPARLGAGLLVAAARGGRANALRAWVDEGGRTASPNAGQVMAVAAGALGVRLEKVDAYCLNACAPLPTAATIALGSQLVRRAMVLGALLALGACLLRADG